MSVVIFLVILYLSVICLCDVFQSFRLALLRVKNGSSRVVFCLLKDEFAELNLRCVIEQYKWSGKQFADRIVAINYLEDAQLLERCKLLAESYKISVIDENQIHNYLNSEN